MNFLTNFRRGPTPLWLENKDVKEQLAEAILQRDSLRFREILRKHSPDPDMRGIFAVCVMTPSGMDTVAVNEAGESASAETEVGISTPIHILNMEFLDGGIRVTIGEDVFMAPIRLMSQGKRRRSSPRGT
jgi:hypothetical protein